MKRSNIALLTSLLMIGVIVTGISLVPPKSKQIIGPLAETMKINGVNFMLRCELPAYEKNVPVISFEKLPLSEDDILYISKTFNGVPEVNKIIHKEGYRYDVLSESKDQVFDGKNHFMVLDFNIEDYENTYSEEQNKKIADEFVSRILEYLPESSCAVEFAGSCVGYETIVEEVSTYHTMTLMYDVRYEGYPIVGNGASISVSLADGVIIETEVHIPYVKIDMIKSNRLNPQTALEIFYTEKQVCSEILEGKNETNRVDVTIESMELVFYYDFISDKQTGIEPCYRILGKEMLVSSNGEIINEHRYVTLYSIS